MSLDNVRNTLNGKEEHSTFINITQDNAEKIVQTNVNAEEKEGEGIIRKATEKDVKQIEKMYKEHFQYEREHTKYTFFVEGVYPTTEITQNRIEDGTLYVYEKNGNIGGCVTLDQKQAEEYKNVTWLKDVAGDEIMVIHLLLVRPDQKGKGIGTSFIQFAEKLARTHSYKVLRIDTASRNIPAATLYQKLGFHVVAKAPLRVGGGAIDNEHLFLEKIL